MTAVTTTHLELDTRGIAWIAGSNVKVIEVVLDKIAHGWSPDEIHFQHPDLSLAQIHAALAYYHENQSQLDSEIKLGLAESAALASELSDVGLKLKLTGLQRSL